MSTEPVRLLFDENFGKPLIDGLANIAKVCRLEVEVVLVLDLYKSGTPDDEWLAKIREGWIVISSDRAKRCGGPKLPQICRELKITHVLLSKTLHEMRQFEKLRAVLFVWPKLMELPTAPLGSRWSLRMSQARDRIVLVPSDPPLSKSATAI